MAARTTAKMATIPVSAATAYCMSSSGRARTVVLLGQLDDLVERRDLAIHAEGSVRGDELEPRARRVGLAQLGLQVCSRAILETPRAAN